MPIIQHEGIYEKNIPEHLGISDMSFRINEFTAWLLIRKENCIVVVGHSAFFRDIIGEENKMKNCEVRICYLSTDGHYSEPEVLSEQDSYYPTQDLSKQENVNIEANNL